MQPPPSCKENLNAAPFWPKSDFPRFSALSAIFRDFPRLSRRFAISLWVFQYNCRLGTPRPGSVVGWACWGRDRWPRLRAPVIQPGQLL